MLSTRPRPLQILRCDAESEGVADAFVETVVGALLEQDRELEILMVVVIVPELVMEGDEILFGRLDAHLDTEIVVVLRIPGAGMTDHIAIAGA